MPRMSSEPSSDHKAGQQAFRQLLDGGRVGHRVEVTHQNHLTSSLRDVSGRPGIILRIRILANDSHDVVGRGLAALVLYLSLYFPCRDASQPHFPPLLRGRGPWKFRKSRVRPKGSSHQGPTAPRFGRGGVAGGPIGHRAGRTTDHAGPRRSPPARGLPAALARCHTRGSGPSSRQETLRYAMPNLGIHRTQLHMASQRDFPRARTHVAPEFGCIRSGVLATAQCQAWFKAAPASWITRSMLSHS